MLFLSTRCLNIFIPFWFSFKGNVRSGIPFGSGIMRYQNGSMVYNGAWDMNGKYSDKGTLRVKSNLANRLHDDDTYEGEFRAGKKSGEGAFTGADGSTYRGQWKEDQRHGRCYESKDTAGNVFEGEYKHNVIHGEGTMRYANGDKYVGSFSKGGIRHGKGTFSTTCTTESLEYTGYFKDGKYFGSGEMTRRKLRHDENSELDHDESVNDRNAEWTAGDWRYSGQWVEGLKHGKGTLVMLGAGEETYEGTWENDAMQGSFLVTWPNGDSQERCYDCGDWNDAANSCSWKYADGSIYSGQHHNGVKNGRGTMVFARTGDTYTGDWVANKMDGVGEYLFFAGPCAGDVYQGKFVDNRRQGFGSMRYSNGELYEGEWRDNKRNGQGKLTYQNGDIVHGQWETDQLTGKVKILYSNGDSFDGLMEEGKRNGFGTMRCSNGDCFEGNWAMNQKSGRGVARYGNGDVLEVCKCIYAVS